MTLLWLIFWLIGGTPAVQFGSSWNGWAIGLVVCIVIDLLGGSSSL